MTRANPERPPPKIRLLVAYGLQQANELPLIGHKLMMARGKRPAEERKWAVTLMKDGVEPHAGRRRSRS